MEKGELVRARFGNLASGGGGWFAEYGIKDFFYPLVDHLKASVAN